MLNPNLARSALCSSGFGLCGWSLIVVWFSLGWAVVLVIVAMVFLIAAGAIERVDEDCGYDETVHGGRDV